MEYYPENCESINPVFNELFTFINKVSQSAILQKIRLENTCFNTDEKFEHLMI